MAQPRAQCDCGASAVPTVNRGPTAGETAVSLQLQQRPCLLETRTRPQPRVC